MQIPVVWLLIWWCIFFFFPSSHGNIVTYRQPRPKNDPNSSPSPEHHLVPADIAVVPLEPNPTLTNQFISGNHSLVFQQMYNNFVKMFDHKYPTPRELFHRTNRTGPFYNPVELSNFHHTRCIAPHIQHAKDFYLQGKFFEWFKEAIPPNSKINTDFIMFTTSCFADESLGNYLSDYFENLLCAYYTGLHFMSVSFIWEPMKNDTINPFFSKLPYLVEHSQVQTNLQEARKRMDRICNCPVVCHEQSNALWTKGLFLIRSIYGNALQYHYEQLLPIMNSTVIHPKDLSNVPSNEILPLIPDVAIHYRCSDNFVNPYGFLPFRAFTEILTQSYQNGEIQTIYVLAESNSRGSHFYNQVRICDEIFPAIFRYLTEHFPNAKILIRRGDDVYADLIRLSYANVTICSASTFCLYPAIYQGSKAYFPKTNLVVKGHTEINLGFHWIINPSIILGLPHSHDNANQLAHALTST